MTSFLSSFGIDEGSKKFEVDLEGIPATLLPLVLRSAISRPEALALTLVDFTISSTIVL